MYYFRLSLFSLLAFCFVLSPTPGLKAQNSSETETVPMTIISMPIEGVLQLYRRMTGLQIIEGINLNSGPPITIKTDGTVPKAEAIRLIEAALLLYGYIIVPSGTNTIKVLNSQSQNPRSEGLPIYTDINQLPDNDHVVSFFTNVDNISPSDAVSALNSSINPSPYTVILAIDSNLSIIMTEKISVIRQLVRLKELIDTPQASLKREFIQLQRADAENVAQQLQNLFQNSGGNRPNRPSQPRANPNNNPNNRTNPATSSADAINALDSNSVKIVPDPRTNRILVVAPKSSFEYLKQLVLEFDSAVDFSKPFNRQLRYVKAAEILPVLGDFLAQPNEQVTITDAESSDVTDGGGGGGGGGGGNLSRPDQLSDSGLESAPQSLTVGKTRIIADRRNNSILIMGPTENINRAASILDSLDIPAQQVFLSTVIGQLTLDDTTEFGVDILRQFNETGDFGTAGQSVTQGVDGGSLIDPRTLLTTGAFPAASAGAVLYGTFLDSIDVFVRALKTTNNFKILSRPTVFTTNNTKAVILSGRREPIPTQSLSSLNTTDNINSSVTTNVDFEDVVLKLEIIPLINSDNQITLTIAQQNDSLLDTTLIGGNSVPIISTQELLTTVTVNDRNTVILGGLIEDSAQDGVTGIPLLSDIPLVGTLFKDTTKSRPRNELIIMVQPEIVRRVDDVINVSDRRLSETFVGPSALEFSEKGGAVRTELNSIHQMKKAPNGELPIRAEVVPPSEIQFVPPEIQPIPSPPRANSLPALPEPEEAVEPEIIAPSTSVLIQPRGIELPENPQ